jgi:hypothetical protein
VARSPAGASSRAGRGGHGLVVVGDRQLHVWVGGEEFGGHRSAAGADLEQLPAWPQTLQRPGQHHPAGEGPPGAAAAERLLEP